MSPITIEIADPAEFALELAALEALTFNDEQISALAFGPLRNDQPALQRRADELQKPPKGFTSRMTKAVRNEDGTTVGAAVWKFYYDPMVVVPQEENKPIPDDKWPPGSNAELCEELFGWADKHRETRFGGKRFAVLNLLIVKPGYQRQGIGSLLLKDGLDIADAAGLPVWLGSSESGYGLYLRNHFKLEGEKTMDLKKYGGDIIESHKVMVRDVIVPADSKGLQ